MTFIVHGTDPGIRHCGQALLVREARGWHLVRHHSIAPRKDESVDDRMRRIMDGLYGIPESRVSCYCFELQNAQVGAQRLGEWQAGNFAVHEVVGAVKMAAYAHRVPCLGMATSSVLKAVTGSGKTRGQGVEYPTLERALRAQVRGIPDRVSQHVLMAIACAVAGARTHGGRGRV